MENPNERKIFENENPSSNKFKWTLACIGLALVVSLAFNLFFAFDIGKTQPTNIIDEQNKPREKQTVIEQIPTNDDTFLREAHKIDKAISKNGITWLGIKATPDNEADRINYELWRVDEKNKKLLIENFLLSLCGGIEWDLHERGGIDLLYTTSPCEAYGVATNIIYDTQGTEQFRMIHKSNAGNFIFKQDGRPEYVVSLLVEGTCNGSLPEAPEESSIPEVLLKGVKFTTFKDEKEFLLTKPVKILCGIGYIDEIIDPIIVDPVFDEEKIEFTLPNKQKAIISLLPSRYAEVEFK